jgi:hypothetical protein
MRKGQDEDDPGAIAACLREALAPGSYLASRHRHGSG